MKKLPIVFLVIFALTSACSESNQVKGDPEIGAELFFSTQIGEAPGCKTCHSIHPDEIIVGPSLAKIGITASSRIETLSSSEYIEQSILQPNSYLVEGYSPNIMYQNFADVLTKEQVNDLVAYLLTIEE